MSESAVALSVEQKAEAFIRRKRRPWGWFRLWIRPGSGELEREALVYVPMKCGSTSFRFTLVPQIEEARDREAAFFEHCARHGLGPFTDDQAREFGLQRILAVRNPVSRFSSMWRDIDSSPPGRAFSPLRGVTPLELLEICSRYLQADPHFEPQAAHYDDDVELVRFDRLNERLCRPPEHRRRGKHGVRPELPVDEIRKLYREDVRLWQIASGS